MFYQNDDCLSCVDMSITIGDDRYASVFHTRPAANDTSYSAFISDRNKLSEFSVNSAAQPMEGKCDLPGLPDIYNYVKIVSTHLPQWVYI
jgi:hypothetical protein